MHLRRLLCASLLLASRIAPAQTDKADLILLHGHILTEDARDSVAQAIAIRKGVILKAGTDQELEALAAPGAKIIDLHGRTATPGLIDTHAHISLGGVDEVFSIPLSDATSVAEIVARVKARAAQAKPDEWILGAGWDEGKLAEHRYVTAEDLDKAAPNNPVWLMHTTHHYGVANSLVLKMAHIDASTPDPEHGTIDRYPGSTRPTGVLKEETAMTPVLRLIPATTVEQFRQGLLHNQKVMLSEGMTAVKDPEIEQPIWNAYKSLLDSGQLKIRVCVLWAAGTSMETARKALAEINSVPRAPATLGNGHLVSCGVKLFMDGSGGARTGWSWDAWLRNADTPDYTDGGAPNAGYPHIDPTTYREMVRFFHTNGVNIGTHAVGDQAMDWVVDSYAEAEKADPRPGLRHSIIHANLPTPHALDVIADLERKYDAGYPEMQAEFLWWIGDIYAASYGAAGHPLAELAHPLPGPVTGYNRGPERAVHLIPLKTLEQRGILWSGGSDYNVTPLAARYGLWASVARQTARGTFGLQPFGLQESVSAATALRSYTAWSARQLFLEDRIGTLEAGKQADIAVWDRDITQIPTDQIKEMKCLMTLVDGEVVYRSPDFR